MKFLDQPPSQQWSALKYKGETIAEVWFKPEDEPFGLTFRVRRAGLQTPGVGQRWTPEHLLRAVGLEAGAVESWRWDPPYLATLDGSALDLRHPFPTPSQDVTHLTLHVRLKPPPKAFIPVKGEGDTVPETVWQDLEARWNAILGLEASIDTMRISMESLRSELEASRGRQLKSEEKFYALNADVAVWNKAKSRVHFALPKLREFIHRAVWALGAPERKKLDELFKTCVQPRVPFPEMGKAGDDLESLRKSRQVMSGLGMTLYQECKNISAEVQGALRTLQANARAKAIQKRGSQLRPGRR